MLISWLVPTVCKVQSIRLWLSFQKIRTSIKIVFDEHLHQLQS